jgi:hypothetical protein
MLKLPGDELGNGGGIDFGTAAMRTRIDSMQSVLAAAIGGQNANADAAALCAKVKGYAERTTSTAAILGLARLTAEDVRNARADT